MFILATIITQIGGIAYLGVTVLAWLIPAIGKSNFICRLFLFLGLYVGLWSATIFVAPQLGRVALPCQASDVSQITVQSPFYCVLNRHYVSPELLKAGNALAAHINTKYPGTQTLALDANFPFFDGFPLLPHLSHNDGRKLDIAFYYKTNDDKYALGDTKSPIGYWAFEQPAAGSSQPCVKHDNTLSLRWDMEWFYFILKDYKLDEARTAEALRWLATQGRGLGVTKVFLEPHLVQRLRSTGEVIRFQGCQAARHDDHIHLQIN